MIKEKKTWITFTIGILIAVCVCFFKKIHTINESSSIFLILSDACFTSAVFIGGVGLLLFISNEGNFDMLAYGVKTIGNSIKKSETKKLEKNLFEYRMARWNRRIPTKHLISNGFVFLAVSAFFALLYLMNS